MLSYTNFFAFQSYILHFFCISVFFNYFLPAFLFQLRFVLQCMFLQNIVLLLILIFLHLSLPLVHAAGAKVKDLEDEADRLLEKLQPIKKLQDNLRRNISQIKELINQARKQANSVCFLTFTHVIVVS